jgi:predicted nucleic acid-binding Zn ribbon protein
MTIHCIMCTAVVPEKRAWRNIHTCSQACQDEFRKQRRAWKAERACRLCGRPARKAKAGGGKIESSPCARRAQDDAVGTAAATEGI